MKLGPFHGIIAHNTTLASLRELSQEVGAGCRVLCVADPNTDQNGGQLSSLVRSCAVELDGVDFFLMSEEPSGYASAPWPENVWLGVRACTNAEAAELCAALAKVPHRGRKWLSCTPRDAIVVPAGLNWVFCNADGIARPMYPALVQQLKDSASAQGVRFWFNSWDGWYQTFRYHDPHVQKGDALVRVDGVIVGEIDQVLFRDDGTIREMTADRIPHESGRKDRSGKAVPKYKRVSALSPEIFMRREQGRAGDDMIEKRKFQDTP